MYRLIEFYEPEQEYVSVALTIYNKVVKTFSGHAARLEARKYLNDLRWSSEETVKESV